jgi:autotransporter strand-loop-strand O-heptosyltransferase
MKENFKISYFYGPKVEIEGDPNSTYLVAFIDNKDNSLYATYELKGNNWCHMNIYYFVDWRIEIFKQDILVYTSRYSAKDKNIVIVIDSNALGDTIAWFPYIKKFKDVHHCNVIACTFHNSLFEKEYNDIIFQKPNSPLTHDVYANYYVGHFNRDNSIDDTRHPLNYRDNPLQKTASDILGLDYEELKPRIYRGDFTLKNSEKENLVTIGIYSTAECKLWNNPIGWPTVIDYLVSRGVKVKLLSNENNGYMGHFLPDNLLVHPAGDILGVIRELEKSRLFIGIGSGLTWLSWSLNVPTILISGFSYPWSEMQTVHRISTPKNFCSGCFNRIAFVKNNWKWCPDYAGTNKEFECTKSISAETVIRQIDKIL